MSSLAMFLASCSARATPANSALATKSLPSDSKASKLRQSASSWDIMWYPLQSANMQQIFLRKFRRYATQWYSCLKTWLIILILTKNIQILLYFIPYLAVHLILKYMITEQSWWHMIIWRTLLDFVAFSLGKTAKHSKLAFFAPRRNAPGKVLSLHGSPATGCGDPTVHPSAAAAPSGYRSADSMSGNPPKTEISADFSADFFGSKSSKRCEQEASCLLNRFKKNMNAKTVLSAICFCNGGEIFHEFLSEFIGSISGLERSRQTHLALLCESSCGQGAFAQPFMRCLATSGRFPMVLRTRCGSILECSDQREQWINGTSETSCARSWKSCSCPHSTEKATRSRSNIGDKCQCLW